MRPPHFRGVFRDDLPARAVYSEGAGIARIIPRAIAVPADEDDVTTLVQWASDTATPLVPRGSGSGMAGGAVGDGVIVDLGRLDTIGEIDADGRFVIVGAGAICGAVNAAAAPHGLRFPAEPSSGEFCTVGGMVATNAAGARSLRYGPTRTWVNGIECVFDDGTRRWIRRRDELPWHVDVPAIARFAHVAMPSIFTASLAQPVARIRHGRVRKESSGYALADYAETGDLVDLLVGSEGTLALFTRVELRLAPIPAATASLLAAFDSLESAAYAAARARDADASACELLDRTFLEIAAAGNHSLDLPAGSEAVLLVEVEGADPEEAAERGRTLESAFLDAGATAVQLALLPSMEASLWSLRHAASPTLARLDPALKSMQFIEDGAVPPEHLPEYVRGVREALETHEMRGVIFGHAGDAHVHVNPLVDVGRLDWRARMLALLDEIVELTARLEGTLAGEHGDGRLRTPLLTRVWAPDATVLFELVKRRFDPVGIFNPGVKIPLPGQRAIDAVKYDPALPPLPAPARRVLDRIERDREYARSRLELLEEGEAG